MKNLAAGPTVELGHVNAVISGYVSNVAYQHASIVDLRG